MKYYYEKFSLTRKRCIGKQRYWNDDHAIEKYIKRVTKSILQAISDPAYNPFNSKPQSVERSTKNYRVTGDGAFHIFVTLTFAVTPCIMNSPNKSDVHTFTIFIVSLVYANGLKYVCSKFLLLKTAKAVIKVCVTEEYKNILFDCKVYLNLAIYLVV